MQTVEGCAAACTDTKWPSMCQGFYTGPGVSRYQYCHDAARADNKAACDAASTCCDWVLPDPDVNTATMDAREYCDKLNDKMAPFPIDQHADICTKTTCCQMITEQNIVTGVQETKCQSKLPNDGSKCEGSCSAKDTDNSGFVSPAENQAGCSLGTTQAVRSFLPQPLVSQFEGTPAVSHRTPRALPCNRRSQVEVRGC